MKNTELVNLYQGLNSVGNLTGTKFCYAVSKNIEIIKGELKHINSTLEHSDEEKKYEDARIALCKKLCKLDEKDKPMVVDNPDGSSKYVFEDQEGFDKELKKLQKKHEKSVESIKKKKEGYNKFLKEEVSKDVKLHKIKLSDVPEEITAQQMNSLFIIIVDDADTE